MENEKIVNAKDALEKLLCAIEHKRTTFHELIFKIMQPFDKNKSITVDYFKEVAKLGDGKSFGELALLKNAGRAATIICAEPTRFATLHRKDYKLTIGAEVRRKLKENVRMLR